uniref:Uncharacterized protein n=1 Tax=Zea mays TaxID=4577 RepID=A0A804PXH0_MAIZE
MTAADGEACAVVATAADIICSLRGADLAGWTPPWSQRQHEPDPARDGVQAEGGDDARDLAWPAVARGKRSRSRRESPSASGSAASAGATTTATKKKTARRGARGSPASPLDYSGASGSGSGASTSGGEDGAFCSRPDPALPPAAACQQLAAPPPPSKTRLHQSITLSEAISVENKGKPRPLQPEQEAPSGFVLPDLNLPADV